MSTRQKLTLGIAAIFMVTLTIVGVTYAYFVTQVQTGTEAVVDVKTANVGSVEYQVGNGTNDVITLTDVLPGTTMYKTFKVFNNTEDTTSSSQYNVFLTSKATSNTAHFVHATDDTGCYVSGVKASNVEGATTTCFDGTAYNNVKVTLYKVDMDTFNSVADVTLDADFTEPTDEKYVAAKNAKCFEYENSVISGQELSTDKKTLTFKVTITYKWGEIFNYSNPYTFYNDGKESNDKCGVAIPAIDSYAEVAVGDATWADHANYYLRVLGAIQNTVSYSLTVSATPATA